jgi:hypothetical protein
MASTGHSGSHKVQSMHSSGSITRKLGPSWKQSTGQTSTQSVSLHLMQDSVTTNVMLGISCSGAGKLCEVTPLIKPEIGALMPLGPAALGGRYAHLFPAMTCGLRL